MQTTPVYLIVLASLLTSCGYMVSDADVCRTLATQGFRGCTIADRNTVAPSWAGCGESDALSAEVQTVNPLGASVVVTVCCGWPFKGCTIRSR